MSGITFRVGRTGVAVTFPLLLLTCSGFLLNPALTGTALTAVLVHELAHIVLLRVFCRPIWSVRFGLRGAIIRSGRGSGELACALAGPLADVAFGLFLLPFQRTAGLCVFALGAFHLLPLPATDGEALLGGLSPEKRISTARAVCLALLLTSVILSFCRLCPWFLPIVFLIRLFRGEKDLQSE